MGDKWKKKLSRRSFCKMAGLTGISATVSLYGFNGSMISAYADTLNQKSGVPKVPRRRLGKTDTEIPSLAHGVMYNLVENQIVIYNGLKWGINMIDTSNAYAGGNSELGIGKFFEKNPDRRSEFFIVSKASGAKSIADVEAKLQLSLKRMNTTYVDLYYGVHGLSDPSDLTDDLRKWAEGAKKRKLIKYFGFSTHQNMAKCLQHASKLPWIDALMTSYNFRLMQDPGMQDAVEACHQADIGLLAMKVMGLNVTRENDKKTIAPFMGDGINESQAKLKAVLGDKRFASAVVTMNTVDQITINATAVTDRKKLSRAEHNTLKQYSLENCSSYCTGCSDICRNTVPGAGPYISDIMRYLMYYNSYNEKEMAMQGFAEIPASVRRRLLKLDYTAAERHCPQGIPVGSLINEACYKLI